MKASFLTPAITLFREDGTLDTQSQAHLYDFLIEKGTDGLLVEGSSSEFFAMTMEQRRAAAQFAIEHVNRRVKLIVGTSSMVASEIVELSRFCLERGADAVMILPPYYFHFGDEALLQYYGTLARQIDGPIYIYNFPDNTGYTVSPEVVLELARTYPNIVGIKDTTTGIDHTREVIKAVKAARPDFEVYSGLDDNLAHNVLDGGDGCISALCNVVPEVFARWVRAAREEDLSGMAACQQAVNRLMDLYQIRSPFLPVFKKALQLRGVVQNSISTFPMPNAGGDDDARITEILGREGIACGTSKKG